MNNFAKIYLRQLAILGIFASRIWTKFAKINQLKVKQTTNVYVRLKKKESFKGGCAAKSTFYSEPECGVQCLRD